MTVAIDPHGADFAQALGIADGLCGHIEAERVSPVTAAFICVALAARVALRLSGGDVLAAQRLIGAMAEQTHMEALNLVAAGGEA